MVRGGGEGGLAAPAGGAAVVGGRWLTRAGNQLKCSQLLQILYLQNIFEYLHQGFILIHNTVLIFVDQGVVLYYYGYLSQYN